MNVIVTGASRGIGKAIAEAFAAEGADLFLCARSEVKLYSTVSELQTKYPGCRVNVKPVDMSDPGQAKEFGVWCLKFGVPDILINNAGEYIAGDVMDEPEGALEKMMQTNLYSAYHLTRSLLPAMVQNKIPEGRQIYNICSVASLQAYPGGGGYSISKFAMLGFSKNLRHELMPHGIKVIAVCPGAVMTDSWGDFDNSSHRIMEAADIAKIILASSKLSPQAVVEEIILRPQKGDL